MVTTLVGPDVDVFFLEGIAGTIEEIETITGVIRLCEATVSEGAITAFALGTAIVEVGATVANPSFTASYDGAVSSALLDDDEGSAQKDVTSTPTAFSSDETYQKTVNNDEVAFTLSAIADGIPDSEIARLSWRSRTFAGVDTGGLLTEAQIEALSDSVLDNDFRRTFTVNAPGSSDYIWYCFPQSFDPSDLAVFQVGILPGGFTKQGVVSVTNPNGITQDYACWRSNNSALGSTTVMVS